MNSHRDKPKLLIIAGAGASVSFDMPSVAGVDDILNKSAQRDFALAADPSTNLYAHLKDKIDRYFAAHVRPHLRSGAQFEDALYAIYAMGALYAAGQSTAPLGALVAPHQFPDIVQFGNLKAVDRHTLGMLASTLTDDLLDDFRARCKSTPAEKLAPLMAFFAALREEFECAVVTLNYDDLIYRCVPGIETGFDPADGRFDERRLIERPTWSCMLHLHGSVHFDMRVVAHDLHEIHWQEGMNAPFNQNSSGRGGLKTTEGLAFPTSSIVAGYGKTLQMLRRPFRTYYSELDRLVLQSDGILCLGYGFADAHLNEALDAYRDERRRPVGIVDYCSRPETTMTSCGCDIDEPSRQITTALSVFDTHGARMTWLGYKNPGTIADLKGEPELSDDPDRPLAIWYSGMLAACANPAAVINRLQSAQISA